MNEPIRILFAGGGTGGHLFPGLAVADELQRRAPGARIAFCGTGRDWEREQVRRSGYKYHPLPAAPLTKSPWGLLRALVSNGMGYRVARRTVYTWRPDLVVGLGGYSSVPLGLAAARQGIPLIVLEQNVIPGRANQLLARWARSVCVTFESTAKHLPPAAHVVCTGNPVRASIVERAGTRAAAGPADPVRPTLIILGGSQGAGSLNRCVTDSLPRVAPLLQGWSIVHQTGTRDAAWVREAYAAANLPADVTSFIDDVAELYGRARLAICRAGATTLAELAVAGVPAILLPYPRATADHQWHNAQEFGRAGAAVVVADRPEAGRSAAGLTAALQPLLKVPELRTEMHLAMLQLARPGAAAAVASEILGVLEVGRTARQSA